MKLTDKQTTQMWKEFLGVYKVLKISGNRVLFQGRDLIDGRAFEDPAFMVAWTCCQMAVAAIEEQDNNASDDVYNPDIPH
jgi:hypothetical protein